MVKIRNNSETIYRNKEKIDINKEDECQKHKRNCIKYTVLKEKYHSIETNNLTIT